MRRHTDYENMVAAYDGLSVAERREVDAHLAECPACAADLLAFRQMDGEIRSARALKASAGLRVQFSEAISGATAAPAPSVVRPIVREPVIRKAKRTRQPWTWSRALVPVGFILLFALVIGLSLPRGGGNESEVLQPQIAAPPQQAAIVKLSFTCEDIPGYVGYEDWYKLLAAFQAENPDVEVEFTPAVIAATNGQSYEEAVADAAKRIDVFCAMPDPSDLQAGAVANLAPYIANDPAFNPDDFYPNLLRAWEDGSVLSIPMYFKPLLISYNPETFDKAGVPYPKPGWTWDDFLATATALGKVNGDKVEQWGYYETGAALFSARLQSEWSADYRTPPDYATMADILGWYEKLYAQARAADVPPALGWDAGQQHTDRSLQMLMRAGKVAMWDQSWEDVTRELRPAVAFPHAGNGAHVGRMTELAMSGQTSYPDQAWRLISYISQHLPDAEVPARRSLAEQASFWQEMDANTAAAYRYALAQPIRPYVKLPDEYMFFQEAAIRVAKGEKTVEQALGDLDMQVTLRGGPAEQTAAAKATAEEAGAKAAATRGPVQTVIAEIVTATPTPTRPADATVLTFACYRSRLPYYADAVAAFEAANPGVYVDLKPFDELGAEFGQGAATLRGSLAGAAAQVDALCDDSITMRIRTGEGLNAYRDLAPFIAADSSVDLTDYFEGALAPAQDGERTWGLPRGLSIQMIYYNQAALNQAGVAAPQPGWTQDEFLATALALTQPKADGGTRWGFEERWQGRMPFALAQKPGLVSDTLADLTSPSTQAALQWYVDLAQKHRVMPVPEWHTNAEGSNAIDAAWQAEPVMYSALAGRLLLDSDNWRNRLSVVPFPASSVTGRTTPLEQVTDVLVMSASTQHPNETWRWLVTASKVTSPVDSGAPARRSVLGQECALPQVNAEVCAAYEYALTHLLPAWKLDPQVQVALRDAARAVLVDGKPVDVALREAAQGQ